MSVFTNATASGQSKAYVSAILEVLGPRDPMEVLRTTPAAHRAILQHFPAPYLGIPEGPGKWSAQQLLQHLADSELVWGYRIRMTLAEDKPPLHRYDQDAWSDRLHYQDADIWEALDLLTFLRRVNLRVLSRATDADLTRVGLHSERGEESLDHGIRLYAGHDLVHLRQLERIRSAVMPKQTG
jgi:DinB family protein